VLDCQWIRQLMSYGLLKGAFRPADPVCHLRSLVRQRDNKVKEQSRCIAHIQKALTQMNIQLDHVVSDLMGKTGTAILRAIVAGERDPHQLAALRDRRLRADEDTVARSLRGNWREEHLFALAQALAHYDFLFQQIRECDHAIEQHLAVLPSLADQPPEPVKPLRNPHRTAAQQAALHQALYHVMGVDLTAIPTMGIDTALVLASEIGPDLSRFPSASHFCSWLNLAPPTRISGGKPLPGRAPRVSNRAGQALRQAASNARNNHSFIGASHRESDQGVLRPFIGLQYGLHLTHEMGVGLCRYAPHPFLPGFDGVSLKPVEHIPGISIQQRPIQRVCRLTTATSNGTALRVNRYRPG